MRSERSTDSDEVGRLPNLTVVRVVEVVEGRARLVFPVAGWVSTVSRSLVTILSEGEDEATLMEMLSECNRRCRCGA